MTFKIKNLLSQHLKVSVILKALLLRSYEDLKKFYLLFTSMLSKKVTYISNYRCLDAYMAAINSI